MTLPAGAGTTLGGRKATGTFAVKVGEVTIRSPPARYRQLIAPCMPLPRRGFGDRGHAIARVNTPRWQTAYPRAGPRAGQRL
jgi:hypothetical protein